LLFVSAWVIIMAKFFCERKKQIKKGFRLLPSAALTSGRTEQIGSPFSFGSRPAKASDKAYLSGLGKRETAWLPGKYSR
jgi:hypothetical protein